MVRRAERAERGTSMAAANDLGVGRILEAAGVEFIDENGKPQGSVCESRGGGRAFAHVADADFLQAGQLAERCAPTLGRGSRRVVSALGKIDTRWVASGTRTESLRQQPKEIAREALTPQPATSVLGEPGRGVHMRATPFGAISQDREGRFCVGASTPIRIGVTDEY